MKSSLLLVLYWIVMNNNNNVGAGPMTTTTTTTSNKCCCRLISQHARAISAKANFLLGSVAAATGRSAISVRIGLVCSASALWRAINHSNVIYCKPTTTAASQSHSWHRRRPTDRPTTTIHRKCAHQDASRGRGRGRR